MVLVPIELFFGFIGLSLVLVIIGLAREPKIPALIVFAGMFILPMVLITDNITFGSRIDNIVSTPNTLNVTTGITNVTSYSMNVISNSANGDIDSAPISRAEKVTSTSILIGQSIQCFNIPIQIAGSPVAGNIKVGTLSGAGMIIKQFGATIPASSFTATFAWYEFCLPDGELYTIQSGDNLGITCEGCLTTNGINVRVDDTNPFDGTNSIRESNTAGTWTTVSGGDMTFQLYKIVGIPSNVQVAGIGGIYSYEPEQFAFTEFLKVIFAFYSVILMLVGALITKMGIN